MNLLFPSPQFNDMVGFIEKSCPKLHAGVKAPNPAATTPGVLPAARDSDPERYRKASDRAREFCEKQAMAGGRPDYGATLKSMLDGSWVAPAETK